MEIAIPRKGAVALLHQPRHRLDVIHPELQRPGDVPRSCRCSTRSSFSFSMKASLNLYWAAASAISIRRYPDWKTPSAASSGAPRRPSKRSARSPAPLPPASAPAPPGRAPPGSSAGFFRRVLPPVEVKRHLPVHRPKLVGELDHVLVGLLAGAVGMVLQALDLLVPVLQVLVGVLGPFLDLLRQGGPDGVLRQRFLRPRRQGTDRKGRLGQRRLPTNGTRENAGVTRRRPRVSGNADLPSPSPSHRLASCDRRRSGPRVPVDLQPAVETNTRPLLDGVQ